MGSKDAKNEAVAMGLVRSPRIKNWLRAGNPASSLGVLPEDTLLEELPREEEERLLTELRELEL